MPIFFSPNFHRFFTKGHYQIQQIIKLAVEHTRKLRILIKTGLIDPEEIPKRAGKFLHDCTMARMHDGLAAFLKSLGKFNFLRLFSMNTFSS
jgi:hypothetical protein